ncbi:MAG: hypothetical protein ACKOXP_08855 [Flavobacteriales bacterium]
MKKTAFYLILMLLLVACGEKNNKQSQSFHLNEVKLTLLDSSQTSVSFSGRTHIGTIPYQIINTVNYSEVGEHVELIHGNDTLKIYLSDSFLKDSLYDVNKDQKADLNFIFRATQGFVIYSFPYLKNKRRFQNVPDTICRKSF